jgi:OmpA-OmpF porin, OOP family
MFVSVNLSAQAKNSLIYRFNWLNYTTPYNDDASNSDIFTASDHHAMELGWQRSLSKDGKLALVVPVKFGLARFPTDAENRGRRELIVTGDALAQYHLLKMDHYLLNPYINAGLGTMYNWRSQNFDFNVPLTGGVNVRVGKNMYVSLQSQYRLSPGEDRKGWHHGVGLVVGLGEDTPPPPPDRDKDGILDVNDACPDDPGPAATNGCPDKDGDNVADKDDKCVDIPGVVALAGCPDKDGDGITDADDACPEQKGIAAFRGCPDTDGDGVQDKDDNCPREKGLVSLKGCPDKDGDGIADKDDACPTEKGSVAAKGCPDADGDGVIDKDDACPKKAGDPAHKGCPDTDGDGVYDNEDRCVDRPGPASNKGCPELKKEDKQKLQNVIKNVQFETGKSVLLAKSLPVLDEVVTLMNQYPEYSLKISGHTDNQGNDDKNLTLSKARAQACYDYLVSKGVKAERMSHDGYGETQPVGDNATKEGREKNRRVDFDLFVK